MVNELAYMNVLGKPLLFWLGIVGFSFLVAAAALGIMVMRGNAKMQHHKLIAIAALAIGIVHGIMAMSVYL